MKKMKIEWLWLPIIGSSSVYQCRHKHKPRAPEPVEDLSATGILTPGEIGGSDLFFTR